MNSSTNRCTGRWPLRHADLVDYYRPQIIHQDCLDEVFRCTILAKLLYAGPAWSGFCSAADNGKLDRFLNRCRKLYRCHQLNQDISELFSLADLHCKRTVNTSSIAFYLLNQHNLTIFVLGATVFPLLKNNPAMTVISSPACYFTISTD